jgi:hypothetical protein
VKENRQHHTPTTVVVKGYPLRQAQGRLSPRRVKMWGFRDDALRLADEIMIEIRGGRREL